MQSLSYWEAWIRWWAGDSLAGTMMWGQQMLFWGRLGKLVQFVGGLVAVLDIVGPDRVEAWGRKLKDRSVRTDRKTFTESRKQFSKTLRQLRLHDKESEVHVAKNRHMYLDPYEAGDQDLITFYNVHPDQIPEPVDTPMTRISADARRADRYSIWAFVLLLLLGYSPLITVTTWALIEHPWWPEPERPWWVRLIEFVVVLLVWLPAFRLITSLLGRLSVVFNLISRAWPIVAYYLLVMPTLLLLRGSSADRSLRVFGVMLVVVGFSFDLLAT